MRLLLQSLTFHLHMSVGFNHDTVPSTLLVVANSTQASHLQHNIRRSVTKSSLNKYQLFNTQLSKAPTSGIVADPRGLGFLLDPSTTF